MERRPFCSLTDFQFIKTETHLNLVFNISETIVGQLTAGVHRINGHSEFFVKSGISDALYRIGPKVPSGYISVRAQQAIDDGYLTKKGLTKEHPISRNKTALDIISYFNYNENRISNTSMVIGVAQIYEKGCQIHYVTKDENLMLKTFQQDHTLAPEECYQKVGIELIPYVEKPKVTLSYRGVDYSSKVELQKSLNTTKYQINKMIANGEIIVYDRITDET